MNKKPKFAEIMKRYYTDETLGLEKPKTELPEEVPTNATGTAVSGTGDDSSTVPVPPRKKKKFIQMDGRMREAKKFVERIMKLRAKREDAKKQAELNKKGAEKKLLAIGEETLDEKIKPAKLIKTKSTGRFSGLYVFIKDTGQSFEYQQAGKSGKPMAKGNTQYFPYKTYQRDVIDGKEYTIVQEAKKQRQVS